MSTDLGEGQTFYLLGGVASLLFSALHLNDVPSPFKLYFILSNFVAGLVSLLCAYLLHKRSVILVYVYSAVVAYGIVASILFGSWLNVIAIIIGLVLLVILYLLKKQGELH